MMRIKFKGHFGESQNTEKVGLKFELKKGKVISSQSDLIFANHYISTIIEKMILFQVLYTFNLVYQG